ncbi:ABC transporter ATP-binding protein [Lacisediminimonas profundi]|uniref:ABC transporter ATP-binding protein n=1 Tax=Lacisediminimonas profundi TaxID=2603856 RepID=UPI00124B2C32|nr:ABC transporter ATP-binding protein [Lacisediminimonas profundi]
MLELNNLNTHYGLSHVLQGVDLVVKPGEVVGLFGRNGVGKTTVMKSIAGWLKPSAGSISLDGVDLGSLSPDRIARMGVGFVPEDRRIFPGLTVEENLSLGLLQHPGRSRAQERDALESTFKRFPRLQERRRQAGTTLSGGEQQMLAVARVLVGAPRLVLIDEPTEGLAPMIVDEIFAIIENLREEGMGVLLVEQNVHRAIKVSDRFYALERGQVIFSGDASSASDRERLMAAISL